jgi:hypothetical protein
MELFLAIDLIIFALIVSLIVWLCIWLVRRFRARLGHNVYLLPLNVVFLASSLCYLPFWLARASNEPPVLLTGTELQKFIDNLPGDHKVSYSGSAYFKDKLYISTNVGLAEIENGEFVGLFRVQKQYSVVSGPWIDHANQLLWILDDQSFELLSYNGTTWKRFPMPKPQQGYYSRGDVLAGIRAAENQNGLTITSAGSAWRWNPEQKSWILLSFPNHLPTVEDANSLIGLLPLENDVFIVRHEGLSYLIPADEDFKSDTAVMRTGDRWMEIPNHTGLHFFAENWIAAAGYGYVCTKKGALLRVSTSDISLLDAPGECETLTTTDTGNLLVSFRRNGVYELKAKWVSRAPSPYPAASGDYRAYLASHGNELAYATAANPIIDKAKTQGQNIVWTENAPTGLWLSRNGETWRCLSLKK